MTKLLAPLAKRLFLKNFESWQGGSVELTSGGRSWRFGDPAAELQAKLDVHDERFFARALFGGDIAIGESWMDGEWSSPDLVALTRLAVRNLTRLERQSRWPGLFSRALDTLQHRLRSNSLTGSRRNIAAHYDLSNEFFALFLDRSMMYSCARFASPDDSLEQAQFHKLDQICRRLRLSPADHVLEIGTGWGAFAEHAARHYGCRVTTTTISRQQHEYARRRFAAIPEGERIELLMTDYRRLRGHYDKIVSIEMFEAVGFRNYDTFFRCCDRLLQPDGAMLLQTITMNERRFPAYHRSTDWIQQYIFPGGELASVTEILRSLARATSLAAYHTEEIGTHYARTLADWRRRFHASLGAVRALGFDERFIRMWDYYLATCEATFLERYTGDCQLLLIKDSTRRHQFNEPWDSSATPPGRVPCKMTVARAE